MSCLLQWMLSSIMSYKYWNKQAHMVKMQVSPKFTKTSDKPCPVVGPKKMDLDEHSLVSDLKYPLGSSSMKYWIPFGWNFKEDIQYQTQVDTNTKTYNTKVTICNVLYYLGYRQTFYQNFLLYQSTFYVIIAETFNQRFQSILFIH